MLLYNTDHNTCIKLLNPSKVFPAYLQRQRTHKTVRSKPEIGYAASLDVESIAHPLKRIGPLTQISPAGRILVASYPISGMERSLYSSIGEGMPTLPVDS